MKETFTIIACLGIALGASAQQEQRVQIADFEDGLAWAYSGNTITGSFVELEPLPNVTGGQAYEGENALYVSYDNIGTDGWQWAQFNFPVSVDLTGMREIRMWVYFTDESIATPDTDDLAIRLDLPGGLGLGTRRATTTGEWQELVWKIDRINAQRLGQINNWGGFIAPGRTGAFGEVYIDNIYALRPAGLPEVQEQVLYGFNEEDPNTGRPVGWTDDGGAILLGMGDVPPSEGSNYAELALGSGWVVNVRTVGAKEAFDRWVDVVDIQMDARVSDSFTGSWVQFGLVVQSGINGVENPEGVNGWDGYPEQGFADATTSWKNLVWNVDMTKHRGALSHPDGWFQLLLTTNQPSDQAGNLVYIDNFRLGVAQTTDVSSWSLY